MTVSPSQWLEMGGEPLFGEGWVHDSLDGLLSSVTRGSNTLLPTVDGRRANPRRLDELDETVTWYASGSVAAMADRPARLNAVIEHYRSLMRDGYVGATKPAVLQLANGDRVTADVQVVTWDRTRTSYATATILTRIIVPAGLWVPE